MSLFLFSFPVNNNFEFLVTEKKKKKLSQYPSLFCVPLSRCPTELPAMKFTPSSSVSSSSPSSTNTFDSFSTTRTTVSDYISVVLGRVFCSRSLPTHPSDQLNCYTDTLENHLTSKLIKDPERVVVDGSFSAPSIVARLMGLDSTMPDVKNLSNTRKGIALVTRSQSVNSEAEGWRRDVEEETGEMQSKHRRARSASFSLKVTPGYFEIEDDDFFTLDFESADERKKKNKVKPAVGSRERGIRSSRRRAGGSRNVTLSSYEQQLGRPSLKISGSNDSVVLSSNEKVNLDGINDRNSMSKKKKKKKEDCLLGDVKLETASGLENSSPVSVLDHCEFASDFEVATSEEDARNRSLTSRRTLSSELSKIESSATEHNDNNRQNSQEISHEANVAADESETKAVGLQRKDYHKQQNVEMLNKICRLAEMEIRNSDDWSCRGRKTWNLRDGQDSIGLQLGHLIMNQLIDEEVEQLCRSSSLRI